MENNRNFFITIALSILVLTLWQVFYLGPKSEAQREQARIEEQQQQKQQATQQQAQGSQNGDTPQMPAASGNVPGHSDVAAGRGTLTREAAVAQTQRIEIDTPSLRGSINLTGARLDDIFLKNYHETVDNNSPNIELLAPSPLQQGYFVELGFTGNETTGPVPGPNTVWTVEGNNRLTQTTSVTLTYTNEKNITFKRIISVDESYMFSVEDTIVNNSGAPISLASYGRVTRFNQPEHASATYVLHEGLIG
ncbi:MAG: membrane protein insertase YidC, partial [Brucella intermedia]